MTDVVDFKAFPPALPADVPRVKQDGLPTDQTLDQEAANNSAIGRALSNLNSSVATLGDAGASYQSQIDTLSDEQASQASSITTLDAQYGSISAGGQIEFIAKAGPVGSVAAYGIYVNAGSTYGGLTVFAMSGGSGGVMIDAGEVVSGATTGLGHPVTIFDINGGSLAFFDDSGP